MKLIKEPHYIFLFCILTSIIPLFAVDMPRGLAWAPSVTSILFYALYFLTFNNKPFLPRKTIGLCLIIFGVAALSLLWALHFEVSLKQTYKLAALLPPQILLMSLVGSLSKEQLKPYIHFFAYGVGLAGLYLCFEIFSNGMLFNIIRGVPTDTYVSLIEFNRASAVISIYSFAALALLKQQIKHPLYFLIVLAPIVIALFASESQSAQLSLVLGGAFFFLFPYSSKIAWLALRFTILGLMLSAPFFISYIYEHFAADLQSVPLMARAYVGHRLEIWDYISRFTMQQPLHGFGIEMTRATAFDSKQIFVHNNTVLHPHNFAIQIWVEFGLFGIIVAMGLMNALFSAIQNNFNVAQQKILLPTLMAAMVPAAAAYGMWQGWWIASLFHIAAIALIACKFLGDKDKNEA